MRDEQMAQWPEPERDNRALYAVCLGVELEQTAWDRRQRRYYHVAGYAAEASAYYDAVRKSIKEGLVYPDPPWEALRAEGGLRNNLGPGPGTNHVHLPPEMWKVAT